MEELSIRILREGFCRGGLAGVDEAGRGSLIGSMYMALVAVTRSQAEILEELGVTDSKKLSPATREKLYGGILENSCLAIALRVPPSLIDRRNLNMLEVKGIKKLVRVMLTYIVPKRITVDLVGSEARIKEAVRRTGYRGEIIVEARADARYLEVGAASIIAKVLRDREIRRLASIHGDLGSGYPSDPKTRRWIAEYYETHGTLIPEVRHSWKTLLKLAPGEYRSKAQLRSLLDYITQQNP